MDQSCEAVGRVGRRIAGVSSASDHHPLTVAFDADDTLWHNEDLFQEVHQEFAELLAPWADPAIVDDRLHEVQMANLPRFGYGVKAFTLSLIEAAIGISGGEVDAARISAILDYAKRLMDRPVELIDGVEEVLDALGHHRLMVITKGDVHDQLAKLAASGLAERFWRVEVVANKDADVYGELLERHGIDPSRFVMVGNSMRSDVLPVLELGAAAVHVPYHMTWRYEADCDGHDGATEVPTLDGLKHLPDLLCSWPNIELSAEGLAGPAGVGGHWAGHPA